ncbi:N-carbamoylsarcosine amidase (plasmid) [Cupriavidus necator H850]|uniref:isochorismatase family protein n=1 Tax=Cupriavidus necator TaxID=106590 RepID=UPI00129E4A19|nr:isochorismatase family protein [Cupriavidus necator]KAI3601369.1 N-carbamoylsarcosine amidase [Cupriavidus necator H850]
MLTTTRTSGRPWDGIVPESEQAIYRKTGWGTPAGLGKRPALLIIDVQYRSMSEKPMPIEEAIQTLPTSCGEYGWRAVPHIAKLRAAFRALGAPIIYPYVAPKGPQNRGQFETKVPGVMRVPPHAYEFVAEVAPAQGDILIPKYQASAFHGTPLASHLVGLGVDTLIVTGCTTSGCVRATVIDACALNFRVAVPEDAVYDRSQVSHAVNLFDMASKYADVMPTSNLLEALENGGAMP